MRLGGDATDRKLRGRAPQECWGRATALTRGLRKMIGSVVGSLMPTIESVRLR